MIFQHKYRKYKAMWEFSILKRIDSFARWKHVFLSPLVSVCMFYFLCANFSQSVKKKVKKMNYIPGT